MVVFKVKFSVLNLCLGTYVNQQTSVDVPLCVVYIVEFYYIRLATILSNQREKTSVRIHGHGRGYDTIMTFLRHTWHMDAGENKEEIAILLV